MFLAGIDGGGTHTRVELRDERNQFLQRLEFGPFNLNAIGEEAFRALLRQIFAAMGVMEECAKLCFGAAGVSNPKVGQILAEELERAGFSGKWALLGDQEIALRGAMDGPGAAVIAGTGSICFGKNAAGDTARSGGWGHLIDDGGSGYALGRDVLAGAVRAFDGRTQGDTLLRAVYERLGGSAPSDIVSFVYSPRTDKAAIARFSRLALDLAAQGDRQALAILERGAEDLAALAAAVQKKLGIQDCPIALLGGLLADDNPYRRLVARRLSALGTPVAPAHDALWGAAQAAWEL